ncbi:hypothetical protein GCM10012284_03060 [Mangrovihabitans endophyticus]|uniref:Negative transcriptional regulator, PaiB family n=2 Tax=Mangrovihabitans endophyticus TaxID=1751298 RepID=A0A8J3BWK8_9ACTN|nr:hypothetical protein GCM10012284_03060 [Mangrovihabitans endophyticus]
MYTPPEYVAPDPSWIRDLVHQNPLALLSTNGERTPHATHVPIIADPLGHTEDPAADLTGTVLLGHLNRANPHWSALTDGQEALVVFTGPHGYVSPHLYGVTPAAPTWNFTSVHLRGRLRRLEQPAETMRVVTATVRAFESRFGFGWRMGTSAEYFRRILPGVGAFRIDVDDVAAMFKLSQEQTPAIRQVVADFFARSDVGTHRSLGTLMALSSESDR